MDNIFIDHLYAKLIESAGQVNYCAEDKDVNRNHVSYGVASTYANVLRDLGHEVDIACWEDEGYLKIPKIIVDGKTTSY